MKKQRVLLLLLLCLSLTQLTACHSHKPSKKYVVYLMEPGQTIRDAYVMIFKGDTKGSEREEKGTRHTVYYKCKRYPHTGLVKSGEFFVPKGYKIMVDVVNLKKEL